MNKEENHRGLQYRDGMVVDTVPFNNNENEACCAGGIYFTDKEHIKFHFEYYINPFFIREIVLPKCCSDFQMVKVNGDQHEPIMTNVFRANKIICGKKYNVYDVSTIVEFKLYESAKFFSTILTTSIHSIDQSFEISRVLNWMVGNITVHPYSKYIISFLLGSYEGIKRTAVCVKHIKLLQVLTDLCGDCSEQIEQIEQIEQLIVPKHQSHIAETSL